MIGQAKQALVLGQPFDDACKAAQTALHFAHITTPDTHSGLIRARAKYGRQRVDIRVRIAADADSCRFDVAAFADDIWGTAALSTIERFVSALSRHGSITPLSPPSRLSPLFVFTALVAFLIVAVVILSLWLPAPVAIVVCVMLYGLGILAYFITARWRFRRA